MKEIIGKKINKIFFDENLLTFETDKGDFSYEVRGDCCSQSVFYDFYGVKNLLENGNILNVEEIELKSGEDKKNYQESIEVYGYRLTTESKDFGEVSSVVSFRNYSNSYYGGWLVLRQNVNKDAPEIIEDVVCTQNLTC